jgi:hypothetical protein
MTTPAVPVLPIFRLQDRAASPAFIRQVKEAMDLGESDGSRQGDLLIFRAHGQRIDINMLTCEVWIADEARLWKPDFAHPVSPEEPSAAARDQERAFLRRLGLEHDIPSEFGPAVTTGAPTGSIAVRAVLDRQTRRFDPRQVLQLDWHVTYRTVVTVPNPDGVGPAVSAPLVGRGLQRGVTWDPTGTSVIGRHGAPLAVDGEPILVRAIDATTSQAAFRAEFSQFRLDTMDTELAYELLDGIDGPHLRPVWRHRATVSLEHGPLELPIVSMPATSLVPVLGPHPPRPQSARSLRGNQQPLAVGAWLLDDRQLETRSNAKRMADQMASQGWTIVQSREGAAGTTQWLDGSEDSVESADMAYYAGHAKDDAWYFEMPQSDQRVTTQSVAVKDRAEVLYGSRNLKWIALCACGPLQDKAIGGDRFSDVFQRWAAAFDGLHAMLGFGTRIGNRVGFGERFAQLTETEPVIRAWLRAAREEQTGATNRFDTATFAGVLYAFADSKDDPLSDQVGPNRRVALKNRKPTTFTAIWVPA